MSLLDSVLEDPWIKGLTLGLVVINVTMVIGGWSIWFERKFAGRMQNRPGPTEVGIFGLLQPIADVLKLMQKEEIVPKNADAPLFKMAPPIGVLLVLAGLAVVPLAPGVVAADLDIGILFTMSIASLMVIPVWMAGWASNNKYALLGGMRAAAQAISFEVPLLLAALVPVILAGSLRGGDIVAAQEGYRWFALWPPGPGFVAFGLFFVASLAEANRIPFDIPEAESELVGGITTEYVGMNFGLFYLAEYLHTFISSVVGVVLFWGGGEGPGPDGPHWLMLKSLVLFTSIFWIRWTLLRYRSDQFMNFCWRVLIPLGLGLVMVAALWVGLS